MNEQQKELLVNEGSVDSTPNETRQILVEPVDIMEQKAKQEKALLKAFLTEMEKTETVVPH
jgi:hypothetical protein